MVQPIKALSAKPNNLITYGGKREINLESCLLTSTCTNIHTHTYACIHTHTAGRMKVIKKDLKIHFAF